MNTASNSQEPRQYWTWIWLAYTGFLFIDPILEPSLDKWLGAIAAFVAFLLIFAVYVRGADKNSPLRFWAMAAMFALGLVTFPWNPGASTFFVYSAAFLPFSLPNTRRVLILFLTGALIVFAEGWLFHTPIRLLHTHHILYINWPNTFIGAFLMLVIGGGNIFFAEQRRAACRLEAAHEQNVELAAVAERERIARDLHDVLGHTLSVIVLKAELAGRLLDRDPQRAAIEIADVERTARTALAEVREAIGGYRSRGLLAEIETARRTLEAAGVALECDAAPESASALNANHETVLALALREAVTNIVRHAHATKCTLRFEMQNGSHRLVIHDNGQHSQEREGNGLRGMRERVEALGGEMQLDRSGGTRLNVALPALSLAAEKL